MSSLDSVLCGSMLQRNATHSSGILFNMEGSHFAMVASALKGVYFCWLVPGQKQYSWGTSLAKRTLPNVNLPASEREKK